jgi:hypothetical protein
VELAPTDAALETAIAAGRRSAGEHAQSSRCEVALDVRSSTVAAKPAAKRSVRLRPVTGSTFVAAGSRRRRRGNDRRPQTADRDWPRPSSAISGHALGSGA